MKSNLHRQNKKSLSEAKALLKEGDVLLFRSHGLTSLLIRRSGQGLYSHVGVASKVGENGHTMWECVEFREWKGGRSVNLDQYFTTGNFEIDVYRASSSIKILHWITDVLHESEIPFDGKHVTNIMRKMTGLPYGWARIAWMAARKFPFLRWFYDSESLLEDDYRDDSIYPVCSTAVSYAFNRMGYDLLHNRSDNVMEPSDIARSPLLHYLFTISR